MIERATKSRRLGSIPSQVVRKTWKNCTFGLSSLVPGVNGWVQVNGSRSIQTTLGTPKWAQEASRTRVTAVSDTVSVATRQATKNR